jgi:hypothetical protein
MQLIRYTIKKGDTLEKIASERNTTPIRLKNFHNTHCDFQDLILENEIPRGLEFLIMETGQKELSDEDEKEMQIFFLPKSKGPQTYTSSHLTEIEINNVPLATFTQNQEFNLSIEESGIIYPFCTLQITKNDFDDGIGLKGEFGGLLESVVRLKDYLEFNLTPHGTIDRVENRKQLREKWEKLKEDLKNNPLLSEIPSSQMQEMIEKGDQEFSNSYPLEEELNKSVFHSYLFFPLYGRMFLPEKTYEMQQEHHLISMLFSGERIPLRTTLTITEDKEANEYLVKVESQVNKVLLDRNTLQQRYKEEYPFLKDAFDRYDVLINAMYAIGKEDSILNFADIQIEELVNNNMNAFQRLEIERIVSENKSEEENKDE